MYNCFKSSGERPLSTMVLILYVHYRGVSPDKRGYGPLQGGEGWGGHEQNNRICYILRNK